MLYILLFSMMMNDDGINCGNGEDEDAGGDDNGDVTSTTKTCILCKYSCELVKISAISYEDECTDPHIYQN